MMPKQLKSKSLKGRQGPITDVAVNEATTSHGHSRLNQPAWLLAWLVRYNQFQVSPAWTARLFRDCGNSLGA